MSTRLFANVGAKIRRMRKTKFPFRHCVQWMRQGLRASCSLRSYIFCGEDIKKESQYLTFLQKMRAVRLVPDFLPQPLQRRILPSAAQVRVGYATNLATHHSFYVATRPSSLNSS
jgi:hypothetical protein